MTWTSYSYILNNGDLSRTQQKQYGSTWRADANMLKISTLLIVYSTAKYCALVWHNSVHTKNIDKHLNAAMRTIGGLIKSTPLKWLPVLNITLLLQNYEENMCLCKNEKSIPINQSLPHTVIWSH